MFGLQKVSYCFKVVESFLLEKGTLPIILNENLHLKRNSYLVNDWFLRFYGIYQLYSD